MNPICSFADQEEIYVLERKIMRTRRVLRARRSGVDRHVCNVKATGSNPVESIVISVAFKAMEPGEGLLYLLYPVEKFAGVRPTGLL
jgi:hypothetical protein